MSVFARAVGFLCCTPLLLCGSGAIAVGPSFDCNKARLPSEIAICGSPELSELDSLIGAAYAFLKSTRGRPYADEIGIPFWRLRNSCLYDRRCVEQAQIQAIGAYHNAGAPVSLPAWVYRSPEPTGLQPTQDLSTGSGLAISPTEPTDHGPATAVPMQNVAGTFVVPVSINGELTLKFTIDSGASDVSIPADVVSTLIRTETIKETDFLGEQTYTLADGSTVPSATFLIRSLKVGDRTLENVRGSVAPAKGSLLLGQSFLRRFKSWSIDNQRQVLVLN